MDIANEAEQIANGTETREEKLEKFLKLCDKVVRQVVDMKIQAVREFERGKDVLHQ